MDNMNIMVGLLLAAAALYVYLRLTRGKIVLRDPRLGILDLTGGTSDLIVDDDGAAVADQFASVEISKGEVPKCDVLLLYATLGDNGLLHGTERQLRATIRHSGARIVVLASENPSFRPSQDKPLYGRANIVYVLERKGAKSSRFLRELFTHMKKGGSMLSVWASLVPAGPSPRHDELPSAIFVCEIGDIGFKKMSRVGRWGRRLAGQLSDQAWQNIRMVVRSVQVAVGAYFLMWIFTWYFFEGPVEKYVRKNEARHVAKLDSSTAVAPFLIHAEWRYGYGRGGVHGREGWFIWTPFGIYAITMTDTWVS